METTGKALGTAFDPFDVFGIQEAGRDLGKEARESISQTVTPSIQSPQGPAAPQQTQNVAARQRSLIAGGK
jgi:hypothetical protein